MRLNLKKNSNSAMNKIEAKRLEPKPTRAKPPAMPAGKPSGKSSGTSKGSGKKGVLVASPGKKTNGTTTTAKPKKPLNAVNAGPLKTTPKPNSMADKANRKNYVAPKPKKTEKPVNKKFGSK
jgi:hypothetical protein